MNLEQAPTQWHSHRIEGLALTWSARFGTFPQLPNLVVDRFYVGAVKIEPEYIHYLQHRFDLTVVQFTLPLRKLAMGILVQIICR